MDTHPILISILIPVYNVDRYIERCLDSLHQQISSDCEVILIDDGSTDKSGLKCDQYSSRNPHYCQVYHKENQGAYPTRNFAMDRARGKYLWFIDPDDYIHPDAISNIRKSIETQQNPDVITAGYCKCNDNWIGEVVNANKKPQTISGEEYLTRGLFNAYLWANIYRRDFLLKNHIRFNDHLNTQGDWLFNTYVYVSAQRIFLADFQIYYYYQGNAFSTLARRDQKHLLRGVDNTIQAELEFVQVLESYKGLTVYKPLRKRLNLTTSGFFYSLYRFHIPTRIIKDTIKIYQKNGLYPIGLSNNSKANIFAMLANFKWLFIAACYIMNFISQKKNS